MTQKIHGVGVVGLHGIMPKITFGKNSSTFIDPRSRGSLGAKFSLTTVSLQIRVALFVIRRVVLFFIGSNTFFEGLFAPSH